eukprot:5323721-Pyramimonas_sp.AAC.1
MNKDKLQRGLPGRDAAGLKRLKDKPGMSKSTSTTAGWPEAFHAETFQPGTTSSATGSSDPGDGDPAYDGK